MEIQLPSSGTPCRLLKLGQCPKSDGCEYAHDFIAQPCLSAAQIDHQMRGLVDARPATFGERFKTERRKQQLHRLRARKLATPSLTERGILPTKMAIKHELGKGAKPPKNLASPAVRKRAFAGGGGGKGGRQTAEIKRGRRRRKLFTRMKHESIQVRGLSNGNPSTKADLGVSGGAPPSGGTFVGDTTARGSMDVDGEVEIPRRVEIIGDFTVKYPTAIPPHLRHRCSNPSPAAADSPPPQKQPPYTDEGITYSPSAEIMHEIKKEHVSKRDRALSF
ncbi:hypothetical protein HOY80DRAFT_1022752 [Tuber brumale]|nr:hypothetical protein HOY80DRAFT_1022752 [Tuber brumale]